MTAEITSELFYSIINSEDIIEEVIEKENYRAELYKKQGTTLMCVVQHSATNYYVKDINA